ncbi:hypothetical protein [Thiobacter aerophilum]|uniref:DsrE family protein n=1 Tax=Thiobacter aerophilum TaxID=3121275 RepID=A0ABV0EJ35_9BURK
MFRTFLLATAWWIAATAAADDHPAVARLLASDQPPPGVVFEIVTGDPQALVWVVPQVSDYARRLRARFPELALAVVSHGQEMFALAAEAQALAPTVHAGITHLVREEGIPVHVCETYAGWRGVGAEAFPDYVTVSAAGPAQVADYLALGYVRVQITGKSAQTPEPNRVE